MTILDWHDETMNEAPLPRTTNRTLEFENGSAPAVELDDFSSPTGWKLVTTDARLESRHYPLFEEPSPIVVFDFAFSKKVYFNPVTGKVMRVSY